MDADDGKVGTHGHAPLREDRPENRAPTYHGGSGLPPTGQGT